MVGQRKAYARYVRRSDRAMTCPFVAICSCAKCKAGRRQIYNQRAGKRVKNWVRFLGAFSRPYIYNFISRATERRPISGLVFGTVFQRGFKLSRASDG